jgi:hypothetical protein
MIVVPGAAELTADCSCASVDTLTTSPAGAGSGGTFATDAAHADAHRKVETITDTSLEQNLTFKADSLDRWWKHNRDARADTTNGTADDKMG